MKNIAIFVNSPKTLSSTSRIESLRFKWVDNPGLSVIPLGQTIRNSENKINLHESQ